MNVKSTRAAVTLPAPSDGRQMPMTGVIENQTFDEERALYESRDLILRHVVFAGPADGESALKESEGVVAEDCTWDLRYPCWHNRSLVMRDCDLTPLCRAALWYCDGVEITGTKLHGIKALRECQNVKIHGCDIVSPEFGWSVTNMEMTDTRAESEYFFLRSKNLSFREVDFRGKYSFQYVEDVVFENCRLDTKDAFWHGKNITVRNCIVKGEYLAWYSEGLTFENCVIIGTQPLCYCKNLKLVNCEMRATDLSFERSEVYATLTAPIDSIKNPLCGFIEVPAVGEVIRDSAWAQAEIRICGTDCQNY